MAGISSLQQVLWTLIFAAAVILFGLLLARRNYRSFPAFASYIFAVIVQNAALFVVYRRAGFSSTFAWRVFWVTQGIVLCARALAVVEVCLHALGRFRGIWALAWRILLGCAFLVLTYSLFASDRKWELTIPNAERGLELAVAVVLVALLRFARYYEVEITLADHLLAVGLCLYSCVSVINNTILERWLYNYAQAWNTLAMLAFLASLLLWSWALRKTQPVVLLHEPLLSSDVYWNVMPEFNIRLRSLNEQLSQLCRVAVRRP